MTHEEKRERWQKVVEAVFAGIPRSEVATRFGLSVSMVGYIMRSHRKAGKHKRYIAISKAVSQGEKTQAIAAKFGVSRGTVWRAAKRTGVKCRRH